MKVVHALDEIEAPTSLTQRQREFCIQFILNGGHKADAARRSGYALKNSSSIGCRLLKREDIQAHIEALRTEALKRSHITPMSTLVDDMKTVKAKAVVSMADFWTISDDTLRLRNLDELSGHTKASIDKIELGKHGEVVGYKIKPKYIVESLSQLAYYAQGFIEE